MAEIALSNVINISLSALPQGLTKYKTNNVALFVNSSTGAGWTSPDPYIAATSPADTQAVLGGTPYWQAIVNAFFTPSMNLRTGEGTLFVFPYTATNASAAQQVTPTLDSDAIAAFKSVPNGRLTINIDGTDYAVSGLNFSGISTLADIV